MTSSSDPMFSQLVDSLQAEIKEREMDGKYITAYFAASGCSVDFISGEVRDKETGKLRAYLGSWKRELDGSLTLEVQICQTLNFITCDINMADIEAATAREGNGGSDDAHGGTK